MKYAGMPMGMWVLFGGSFRKHLSSVYGYDPETAKAITNKAKPRYKEIIRSLPEFEKADRFQMNIVNCAMLSAFLLNLPERPTVEKTTEYYKESMMTAPMKWFCRMSGKRKFSETDLRGMQAAAALRAARRLEVEDSALKAALDQAAGTERDPDGVTDKETTDLLAEEGLPDGANAEVAICLLMCAQDAAVAGDRNVATGLTLRARDLVGEPAAMTLLQLIRDTDAEMAQEAAARNAAESGDANEPQANGGAGDDQAN